MLTTPRGFRFPENDDDPDIERDMGNLAADVDGQFIMSTAALRPAAAKVGRKHRATDTGVVSLDIGSAWVTMTAVDNSTLDADGNGILRVKDAGVTAAKLSNALRPSQGAGAGTEALRSLGTGSTQAAAGNDSRFPVGADIVATDLADGAVTDPKLASLEAWINVGAGGAPAFGVEPLEVISWEADLGRTVQFYKARGSVEIRGKAVNSGSSNPMPAVFTLPAGYRPSQLMEWASVNCNITIATNGNVTSSSQSVALLDGIRFRVS